MIDLTFILSQGFVEQASIRAKVWAIMQKSFENNQTALKLTSITTGIVGLRNFNKSRMP
jgi:hypothetical protein